MIERPIADPLLEKRLETLPPDGITIFTLGGPGGPEGGDLRGAILHGTRLVTRMRVNHGLGILETLILGHACLAAALVASTLKGRDKASLNLACDGPARGWSVEGRALDGPAAGVGGSGPGRSVAVRGYLHGDSIPVEAPLDSWDTSPFIGSGTLSMTRFIAGTVRPHTGTIKLKAGRLAEDLARYYLESEQTRTAFDLGIGFDTEGRVSGAGAIFLQALPGAREDFVSKAEAGLLGLPSLGAWFGGGKPATDLLASAFGAGSRAGEARGGSDEVQDFGLRVLEELPAVFHCDCSKERFASFVRGSEGGLLHELATEGPWPVVMTCHNCSSAYEFSKEELEAMEAERAKGKSGA
jgi:molecular chaperone Hsp33